MPLSLILSSHLNSNLTIIGNKEWLEDPSIRIQSQTAAVSGHTIINYICQMPDRIFPIFNSQDVEEFAEKGDIYKLQQVQVILGGIRVDTTIIDDSGFVAGPCNDYNDIKYLRLHKPLPDSSFMLVDQR